MTGTRGIIEFKAFQLRQLSWIRAGLQSVLFQFAREDEAAAVEERFDDDARRWRFYLP